MASTRLQESRNEARVKRGFEKRQIEVADNQTLQAHRDLLLGAGDTPTKRKPAWTVLVSCAN
jgi:hypothetical protein